MNDFKIFKPKKKDIIMDNMDKINELKAKGYSNYHIAQQYKVAPKYFVNLLKQYGH